MNLNKLMSLNCQILVTKMNSNIKWKIEHKNKNIKYLKASDIYNITKFYIIQI